MFTPHICGCVKCIHFPSLCTPYLHIPHTNTHITDTWGAREVPSVVGLQGPETWSLPHQHDSLRLTVRCSWLPYCWGLLLSQHCKQFCPAPLRATRWHTRWWWWRWWLALSLGCFNCCELKNKLVSIFLNKLLFCVYCCNTWHENLFCLDLL